MSVLNDLVNGSEIWAAERAQMALDIDQAVKNGEMKPDEAKELLEDLISAEKLQEDSTDARVRAITVEAISTLAALMASAI